MMRLVAFVFALVLGTSSAAFADAASDTNAKIDALQKQLDAVKAQLDALKAQRTAAPVPPSGAAPTSFLQLKPGNDVTFVVGGTEEVTLYGNLDLSYDVSTKGLAKMYPIGTPPEGAVGYQPDISTNLSYIGVRGAHRIAHSSLTIPYQLETQLDISATAGTPNSNASNDNVVKGALTSRNSYVGIGNKYFGAIKIGKTDAPYKTSTSRMNPFSGELGDYSVVMGNTGGDNRAEFMTRLDHSAWYESPNWNGFTFNVLASPGQNRATDNSIIPSGEASCSGGNVPGSGATPPGCNDGSWGSAVSASAQYQHKKLYLTSAYEIHKKVNRTSDLANLDPTDVADEQAYKYAAQYAFGKTTLSGIYENMVRYVPAALQSQNERTRDGFWLAADAAAEQERQPQPRLGARQPVARRSGPAQHRRRRQPGQHGEHVHRGVQAHGRPPLLGVLRLRDDAQPPRRALRPGRGRPRHHDRLPRRQPARGVRSDAHHAGHQRGRTALLRGRPAARLLGRSQPEVLTARRAAGEATREGRGRRIAALVR